MKSLNKNIIPASVFIICSTLFFTGSSCDSDDNGNNNIDTTSHNFVFEIDTLGEGGTSLRDVFAISDDNVWVVGDIRIEDSKYYGAAIWDGIEWKLKQLQGPDINTQSIRPRGIWAFSENDIWFASGSIYHWDGNQAYLEWFRDVTEDESVEKIWGSSNTNIFFVGNKGTIVNYNGSTFSRQESGTSIDLIDIWGTSDNDIWVAGKDNNESVILHYDGKSWSKFYEMDNTIDIYTLPEDEILLSVSSIWKDTNFDTLLTVGAWGTFHVSTKNKGYSRWGYPRRWDIPDEINMGYPFRVRGSAYNNIFVVGQRNSILHYNGKSWHNYIEFYNTDGVWFRSVAVTDNSVYIVGYNVVMRGVRLE